MKEKIKVSSLGKTWILDLDGTLVKHNGYLLDGSDTLLEGAAEFIGSIPPEDMVVIVTSRTETVRPATEAFLRENNLRYDHLIFNAPYGERILINDRKPSGLKTALAFSPLRNSLPDVTFEIDEKL